MVLGAGHEPTGGGAASASCRLGERDYGAMYAQLSRDAQHRTRAPARSRTYREAAETLTLQTVADRRRGTSATAACVSPVTLTRASSARCTATLVLPPATAPTATPGVDWRAELVSPGLRPGERLAPRRPCCRRGPRSRRATARRSPRAPTACRPRPAGLARSPARSARRRPTLAGARRARLPGRRAGRPHRARARVRRAARRHPRRHAVRRRARARRSARRCAAAPCARRSTRSVQRAAVDGARRPLRRDRGRAPAQRRGARRSPGIA